jgi:hypothetical protein
VLVSAGKTFRRVEITPPAEPTPRLCVRLPGPGQYTVSVLHDRDNNHRSTGSATASAFPATPSGLVQAQGGERFGCRRRTGRPRCGSC